MGKPHRKTIKHLQKAGNGYELTFSYYRLTPLLTNNVWRGLLAQCNAWATNDFYSSIESNKS